MSDGKNGITYADAGVDIDAGNALVDRIKPAAKRTDRAGTVSGLGGFGALFDLKAAGYSDPVLVAATENEAYNTLVCNEFAHEIGRDSVYQLGEASDDDRRALPESLRGRALFASGFGVAEVDERLPGPPRPAQRRELHRDLRERAEQRARDDRVPALEPARVGSRRALPRCCRCSITAPFLEVSESSNPVKIAQPQIQRRGQDKNA